MAIAAFLDGIRRVTAGLPLLLGLYAATVAAALPLGIADSLHTGWWTELTTDVAGMVRALGPAGLGVAQLLPVAGDLAGNRPSGTAPAGLGAAFVAVWTFLAGGALDRLAQQRRVGTAEFLAACRHHFWPLARLAGAAAAMYWLLFSVVEPWLSGIFSGAPPGGPTPTTGAETDPIRIMLYALLGAVAAGVGLVFDYARVRAVVEERRSMIGALLAAFRFLRRRPTAVAGLWLLNAALLALILSGCAWVTPGAAAGGPTTWAAFLVGQTCTAARLYGTLVVWAAQTAYFQGQLAHATYVARARVSMPQPGPSAAP